MSVNPQDYNRDERQGSSWWSSRHGRGNANSSGLRKNRRITMIDMLLLVVMAGILVPWFLSMEKGIESPPYRVSFEEKEKGGAYSLILEIRLPRNTGTEPDSPVGWSIFDREGNILHEDWDLPPESGGSREFYFSVGDTKPYRCEIHAGEGTLVINPKIGNPS